MSRRAQSVVAALICCAVLSGIILIGYGLPEHNIAAATTRVDLANKVVMTLAVLVGGLWVLFTFGLFRTAVVNLQLTIQPQAIRYRGDLRIVLINVTLKNVGKVVIKAGGCGCRLSVWRLPADLSQGSSLKLTAGEVLLDDVDLLAGYDKSFPYEIEPGSEYHEFGNVIVESGSILSMKATFYFGTCDEDAITELRLAFVDEAGGRQSDAGDA